MDLRAHRGVDAVVATAARVTEMVRTLRWEVTVDRPFEQWDRVDGLHVSRRQILGDFDVLGVGVDVELFCFGLRLWLDDVGWVGLRLLAWKEKCWLGVRFRRKVWQFSVDDIVLRAV